MLYNAVNASGEAVQQQYLNQSCGNNMPDLSNFLKDKQEISIYLSWEKDFIAPAKKSILSIYFFFFLEENICCGYSIETEVLLMCFLWEISKMSISGQVNFGWTNGFDHQLVPGQVIKFDNSTNLPTFCAGELTRQSAQSGTYTPDQRYCQFLKSTKYVALTLEMAVICFML